MLSLAELKVDLMSSASHAHGNTQTHTPHAGICTHEREASFVCEQIPEKSPEKSVVALLSAEYLMKLAQLTRLLEFQTFLKLFSGLFLSVGFEIQ